MLSRTEIRWRQCQISRPTKVFARHRKDLRNRKLPNSNWKQNWSRRSLHWFNRRISTTFVRYLCVFFYFYITYIIIIVWNVLTCALSLFSFLFSSSFSFSLCVFTLPLSFFSSDRSRDITTISLYESYLFSRGRTEEDVDREREEDDQTFEWTEWSAQDVGAYKSWKKRTSTWRNKGCLVTVFDSATQAIVARAIVCKHVWNSIRTLRLFWHQAHVLRPFSSTCLL